MGDCASRNQTNNITIEGQNQTDPDPATTTGGYERGDFDGYLTSVTISDGKLTIAAQASALNPKLCFVEIGTAGTAVTQAMRDRLALVITNATSRTGGPVFRGSVTGIKPLRCQFPD